MEVNAHCAHLGFRATQMYRPCNNNQWWALEMYFFGKFATNCFSTASGVVA